MLLALDEFHHQRLPRRHVHRVDDALHQAQEDQMRNPDRTREREGRERKGLEHGANLRADQQPMPVEPVHPDTGKRRQEEDRDLAGEADHPQQERRRTQMINQPQRRRLRHPGADQRNDLPGEEQSIIPGLERAE